MDDPVDNYNSVWENLCKHGCTIRMEELIFTSAPWCTDSAERGTNKKIGGLKGDEENTMTKKKVFLMKKEVMEWC